ncbi:inositol monophosphatase family protein [Candidatus Tachikawaea gelatinosa]|uniref:Inositol-1-monophosphatase n=1 Tax=Candidatus Tachikawaea gelatinosa TaxID=1410383 RepID=A0A090BWE0_9ENTR|nr:inositol monophosphatase family protein [Candidatus Tachikawaea gelatinosa]BAP58441.1 inositol monophosphatase [Candidatus Tachikawaea gelatinosa]
MHPMLNIAIRAIRKAGTIIAKNYEVLADARGKNIYLKNEYFININYKVATIINTIVQRSYPHHNFFYAKINKKIEKKSHFTWIINPLDGINNFIKCFPYFAISIAIQMKNKTEAAVIYDPIRNELFTAARGRGAQINGFRLRCSKSTELKHAIVAINFLVNSKKKYIFKFNLVKKLLDKDIDLRCTGSSALNFAYLAAGRIDADIAMDMAPWNIFSGELLIRESGGLVTDFRGSNNYLQSESLISGNAKIVKLLFMEIHQTL